MRLGMSWVFSTSLAQAISARRASVSHMTNQQKKLRAMGSRSGHSPRGVQRQVSEWAYLFPLSTCSQAPSPTVQVSTTLSTPCSGTGTLRMLEHHLQPRPALFSKQFLGDLVSWGAGQPWVERPAQPSQGSQEVGGKQTGLTQGSLLQDDEPQTTLPRKVMVLSGKTILSLLTGPGPLHRNFPSQQHIRGP